MFLGFSLLFFKDLVYSLFSIGFFDNYSFFVCPAFLAVFPSQFQFIVLSCLISINLSGLTFRIYELSQKTTLIKKIHM